MTSDKHASTKSSVIVTTYQAPTELALCLAGLSRQTVIPTEILVADDGSNPSTKAVIDTFREKGLCPIRHIWHPDNGYRKTVICNKAVLESVGEQLLFIDGDSIPHSKWVKDHLKAAVHFDVRCGRRVRLGPVITAVISEQFVASGNLQKLLGKVAWSAICGDTKRFGLGIRIPWAFARLIHPRPRKLMGVNFSVSRNAFFAVNGYDEAWTVRCEDKDLDLRLRRAGFRFYPLLNHAIVYHLHHDEWPPCTSTINRVREEEDSNRVRCQQGLKPD